MAEVTSEARTATVHVKYRFVDGYHIFTSDEVRGLYVASKDAREAFDSVSPMLQELISLKLKVLCKVETPMTFDEFSAHVEAGAATPAAPVMANREFIVRRVPQA
jgi:hypothetical protein